MDTSPSSHTLHSPESSTKRGVKAPLTKEQWKSMLVDRMHNRVLKERTRILARARERRIANVTCLLEELVDEEEMLRNRSLGMSGDGKIDIETDDAPFTLHKSDRLSPDEWDEDFSLTDQERIDLLLHLEETMYRACKETDEREAALDQYEDHQAAEEAYLMSLIESNMEFMAEGTQAASPHKSSAAGIAAASAMDLDDDHPPLDGCFARPSAITTCPVCNEHRLFEQGGFILCRCGLTLDTANGFRLRQLQDRLDSAKSEHRAKCSRPPVCGVKENFGLRALYLWCESCGDMQLIV